MHSMVYLVTENWHLDDSMLKQNWQYKPMTSQVRLDAGNKELLKHM